MGVLTVISLFIINSHINLIMLKSAKRTDNESELTNHSELANHRNQTLARIPVGILRRNQIAKQNHRQNHIRPYKYSKTKLVKGDVLALVEGDVLPLVKGDVLALVEGDVLPLVKGDVLALVEGDVLALMEGDVLALVEWDVLAFGKRAELLQ